MSPMRACDPAEVHRWFLLAARHGHTQARLALANPSWTGAARCATTRRRSISTRRPQRLVT